MKTIFDATVVGGLALKNRLIRSATWEELAGPEGALPEELIHIYEELAEGGVAAIVTGLTNVSTRGTPLAGGMGLARQEQAQDYRRLTDAVVKAHDCRIVAQLALVNFFRSDDPPQRDQAMEIDDLETGEVEFIVEEFAQAAARAQRAGFDGAQIHAAHGFFLSRFISPAFNRRQDEYGGNPVNRARILVEILNAIRRTTTAFNVSVKINFCDYRHGGLMPEDAVVACQSLAAAGIDWIEVSANGTSRPGVRPLKNEAYFLGFAKTLHASVDVPVVLVGGHRSVENMNKVLAETSVEYLSLSRPLIREPDLPNRWRDGDLRPSQCISCNSCYGTRGKRCVFV